MAKTKKSKKPVEAKPLKSPLHNPDMVEYKRIGKIPDKRKRKELLKAGWTVESHDFYGGKLEGWSAPGEDTGRTMDAAYRSLCYRINADKEKQQMNDGKLKIPCNKCGKETGKIDHKHHVGYYGLVNAKVTGGYWSEDLSDCVEYKFSLCEKCLAELMLSFKIPVQQRLYM